MRDRPRHRRIESDKAPPLPIPGVEDINVYDSLDERCAVRSFLGKSLDGARLLFEENDLRHFEDLMWMGPKAFCFYVAAAIDYIRSSEGHPDTLNAFCGLLEFRLLDRPEEFAPAFPALHAAIRSILDRWEGLLVNSDVCGDVYADLRPRYEQLLTQLVPAIPPQQSSTA